MTDQRSTTGHGHEHEHEHGHGHEQGRAGGPTPEPEDVEAFWQSFYEGRSWSGRPNATLVTELDRQRLSPGTALDLGCGTGADAIWLATQGWSVTGLDISERALAQAADAAAAAGLGARVTWVRHDLGTGVPRGSWDLVVASYLHSPVELSREEVLRAAAGAVAPGGTFLVIGHLTGPSWGPDGGQFPSAAEVLATLGLGRSGAGRSGTGGSGSAAGPDGWTVERAEDVRVEVTAPDGSPGSRTDSVVRLRRDVLRQVLAG